MIFNIPFFTKLGWRELHFPKVTKMGLITDQRTDYNGVEVLTDQRYIPKQKLTHITTPGNTCQEKIVLHCLNFDPLLLTKNPSRENQKPVKW